MMILPLVFFLGLCVGSFLNVLIDRIPHEESIWKGRSHCDHCKKRLSWFELIPIFSWIILGAKCRRCHSPISIYYPMVELTTGITFVLIGNQFLTHNLLFNYSSLAYWVIGLLGYLYWFWIASALIVIFFTDWKYGIIPDLIVFPTIIVILVKSFSDILSMRTFVFDNLLAAIAGAALFYLLHIVTKGKGMGFGDVKFVGLMGFLLGIKLLCIALYVAFLTGAAVGVILILARKIRLKATIAFGPFLVLGTVVALVWGDILFRYWSKLLF